VIKGLFQFGQPADDTAALPIPPAFSGLFLSSVLSVPQELRILPDQIGHSGSGKSAILIKRLLMIFSG
jgi:hypothetical protein